jgi:hypothetical protein
MGRSQLGTARFSNLLSLAIIALVLLLMLAVVGDALIPRTYLKSSAVAEFCLGQRIVVSSIQVVWLQGVWLTAPPMPATRVTAQGTEYNQTGTLCGLIPWVSGTAGFWYKELRP